MKKLMYLSLGLVLFFILTGCPLIPMENIGCEDFNYTNDFNYYPQKDTFKIGDTLWLSFSFLKSIKNDCYDVTFEEDSLKCSFSPRINKIINENDTTYIAEISYDYTLFLIKGSNIAKGGPFYFVWDDESQKYITEFGFILQTTGKLFINRTDILIFNEISKKGNPIYPYYNSTFQTNGEPTLQFYVEE